MSVFHSAVLKAIENNDLAGLDLVLKQDPSLANKGITIPFMLWCNTKAHPLHRLCDAVNMGKLKAKEAITLAKLFLDHGSDINGDHPLFNTTPLIAAASLGAEELGVFYVDNGADVHYSNKTDGATALHWSVYCQLASLTSAIINAGASVDVIENVHNSSPLGWAIHALINTSPKDGISHTTFVKILLHAGAQTDNLGSEFLMHLNALAEKDDELRVILSA